MTSSRLFSEASTFGRLLLLGLSVPAIISNSVRACSFSIVSWQLPNEAVAAIDSEHAICSRVDFITDWKRSRFSSCRASRARPTRTLKSSPDPLGVLLVYFWSADQRAVDQAASVTKGRSAGAVFGPVRIPST